MSFAGLLNQTITPKAKTSYDAYGRPVLTSGTAINARVELKQRRRMMPNGSLVVTDGKAFLPSTATLTQDDHFTYNGVEYRVFMAYQVPGQTGQTHHVEIEFMKAKST